MGTTITWSPMPPAWRTSFSGTCRHGHGLYLTETWTRSATRREECGGTCDEIVTMTANRAAPAAT